MTIEDGGSYRVPSDDGPTGGAAAVSVPSPQAHPRSFTFEVRRLGVANLVVGGASVALMIGILLPWFEFGSDATGYFSFNSVAVRSWMYLAFFAALAIVCLLALRAAFPRLRLPLERVVVLLACGANLLLTVVCFAKKAVGLNWDVGAYLSLAAAVAATGAAAVAATSATVAAVTRRHRQLSTAPEALWGGQPPHG
ncbi:MAG TPA: hypothetical protein VK283_02515 [Acidimicrobiales bacterium]|nr:hypothetical protein [Acidimicrobiales bacterium]